MRVLLILLLLLAPAGADPTLQATFDLGTQLSLTALGRAGGAEAKLTDSLLKKAQQSAKVLKVTIPPLPPLTGSQSKDAADALHYLLKGTQPLVKKLNPRQVAIFELGVKSNILRMLYMPGNDMGLVKILQARCGAAKIKDPTAPLRGAVEAKAPPSQFGPLVEQFQAHVREQL